MPVVVGPTSPVAPVTPVVSTDGVLTITPRLEWAAVGAKVDFTQSLSPAVAATVWTVTLFRSNTVAVRGLDRLVAPRGICVGWDQELTPGASQTWFARAYNRAGGVVASSAAVAVTIPRSRRTWVKDLVNPRLSASFILGEESAWSRPRPVTTVFPVGGRFPVANVDVRRSRTATLQVHAVDLSDAGRMQALVQGGPVYLIQADVIAATNGSPDVYAIVGDVDETPLTGRDSYRKWSLPLTEVARPDTTGSSIPIPGLTFGEAPSVPWSSLSGRLVDYAGV